MESTVQDPISLIRSHSTSPGDIWTLVMHGSSSLECRCHSDTMEAQGYMPPKHVDMSSGSQSLLTKVVQSP